ncbi:DNA polymerase III subunit beta [Candidatus Parcubacteria bacterium]|nr:DNA polymerase III subunit beta [Candidatus Parcubacteria bacterium]
MKIETIKEKLVEAVSRAEKVAGKNPTLPVLSGLLLEAKDNTLSIRATNLDLGISLQLSVKVLEEGKVVVPAHVLSAFLNSLSKEKSLTLSAEAQTLIVNTSLTRTVMKTLPAEDFPVIPEIGEDSSFSMPAKDMVSGIKAVAYAAAVGSIKPELSSVCIIHENDVLVFVATDGFRLAEKRVKVKKAPNFERILIPQRNALEIARILDSVDDDVSVSIDENQIALRVGNIYLTSRVIEGLFPDYKQIIPKETVSKVVVLKQDLINSLKTALVFADNFNQLKLSVNPSKKQFEIESKNQDVGENVYTIPAALEGKEILLAVNHRYFTDCFTSVAADSLAISFAGEGRPVVVEGVGDKSFTYLVMPMNRT